MSYSKTTWKTGDTITAQLLNHAEDGIAANDAAITGLSQFLVVHGTRGTDTPNNVTFDDTFAEMAAAAADGATIVAVVEDENGLATRVYYMSEITISADPVEITEITCINVRGDDGDLLIKELSLSTGNLTTLQVGD